MKHLLVFAVFFVMLAGCQSQPAFTDNGNPGQIKAVVFYDDNRNGIMDSGETSAQIEVGISQDISCPASSQDKVTNIQADETGTVIFKDLKPGKYCVNLNGNYNNTTKATQEIYVSSDTITAVMFGIVRQ